MFKNHSISLLILLGMTPVLRAQDGFAAGVPFQHDNYKRLPTCSGSNRNVSRIDLPKTASLTAFAPKVGNQGNRSTSLAWAIAYALTIQEARQSNKTLPADIQKLFYSPAFIYHHIKKNEDINCSSGADIAAAMPALQKSGLLRDADLKTDCLTSVSEDLKSKIIKGTVPNFVRLMEPENFREGVDIKTALSDKSPVIVVLRDKRNPTSWGQAFCLVGYDDNKNGGSFEAMGSFGQNWGINGYKSIRYNELKEQIVYAVEVPTLDWRCTEPFKNKLKLLDEEDQKIVLKPVLAKVGHFTAVNPVTKKSVISIEIAEETAYVYILNCNVDKSIDVLFEGADKRTNKKELADKAFAFSEAKGRNFYCILLSNKILDIKNLTIKMRAASQKTEDWAKCIESALGEPLANSTASTNTIQYNPADGTLNVNMATKQNVVAMMIEFDYR